jgi:hypothetical protein
VRVRGEGGRGGVHRDAWVEAAAVVGVLSAADALPPAASPADRAAGPEARLKLTLGVKSGLKGGTCRVEPRRVGRRAGEQPNRQRCRPSGVARAQRGIHRP